MAPRSSGHVRSPNGLWRSAQRCRLRRGTIELLNKFGWIAMVGINAVRVLVIEVVAARLHLIDADLPSLWPFLAPLALSAAPPIDTVLEMLEPDRLGHRIEIGRAHV